MSTNPYVFIVGCARSGTTLLQRMLDAHPHLAVANDTHFIPKVLGDSTCDLALTPQLLDRVAEYRRIHRFGLPSEAFAGAADGARTFSEFTSRLYDAYAQACGKSFAGEKTPSYVRHAPLLARLFQEARFIHIVRDGRDVALSVMKWAVKDRPPDDNGVTVRGPARRSLWKEDPLGATAIWWSEQVMEGARAADELGERFLEMRYEDLVSQPKARLAEAAVFLGLPNAREMAAYHEGKQKEWKAGESAKKAWLPATKGLRDWRNQMTREEAALFEALAGDALARFGYALQNHAPDAATQSRAARCKAIWSGAEPVVPE